MGSNFSAEYMISHHCALRHPQCIDYWFTFGAIDFLKEVTFVKVYVDVALVLRFP